MSDAYLSWQVKGGLVDAGKIESLGVVAAWKEAGPQLRHLLAGKPVKAAELEPELAEGAAKAILAGIDEDLQLGLESLLRALVARRPKQRVLVFEPSDSEEYNEPHLLDWVRPDMQPTPRLNLLLKLQTALDADPDDDKDRDLTLVACLQLLPDFPER